MIIYYDIGGIPLNINNLITKLNTITPQPMGIHNKYATLIPLIEINGNWEIIFESRAKTLSKQPGEISLPGGRVEDGESFKDAAIRETLEELRISKEHLNYIGELNYLVSYANIVIHCFVGRINGITMDKIDPNPDEVDHLFTVPLNFFIKNPPKKYYLDLKLMESNDFPYDLIPNGKEYKWNTANHSVLFYEYKDYIIWGYTAKMIEDFVKVVEDLEADIKFIV